MCAQLCSNSSYYKLETFVESICVSLVVENKGQQLKSWGLIFRTSTHRRHERLHMFVAKPVQSCYLVKQQLAEITTDGMHSFTAA